MPSGVFLDLPFTYEATVMPGPRHTRARDVRLRAEALVEVPLLGRADFNDVVRDLHPPEFRHDSVYGSWHDVPRTISERGGRLFSPMLADSRPVTVDEFPALVRLTVPHAAHFLTWGPLDPRWYPVRDTRHRHEPRNALTYEALHGVAERHGWPAPRIVASDYDDALARATVYLSGAVAIVDGEVWAECCEPVWHVRHKGHGRYALTLDVRPTQERAFAMFRLDHRKRAMEYMHRRKRKVEAKDISPPVEIVTPHHIERNDLTELAASALRGWQRLRSWCQWQARYPPDDLFSTLDHFEKQADVALYDVPSVMDALTTLADGPGATLAPRARNHAEIEAVFEGVARWKVEKASVDPEIFNPLHDDDWQALQGLPS